MTEQAISLMNHDAVALYWPPHIQIVPVENDTMAPTFRQGDFLAVDTLQKDIREGVYLLSHVCGRRIRRLQPALNGRVLLLVDNKTLGFDVEEVSFEEIEDSICGRVIFAEKRID